MPVACFLARGRIPAFTDAVRRTVDAKAERTGTPKRANPIIHPKAGGHFLGRWRIQKTAAAVPRTVDAVFCLLGDCRGRWIGKAAYERAVTDRPYEI